MFKISGDYKFLVLYLKSFQIFSSEIFFFQKNEAKNFKKSNFSKIFIANYILLCLIWIQNVFSFHLIYILYMQVKNLDISQVIPPKIGNFSCETYWLLLHFTKKLQLIGCFSKTLLVNKDARFHMRPFLLHLNEIWRYVCKMCHFDTPPPYRSTKKPALIRVNQLSQASTSPRKRFERGWETVCKFRGQISGMWH